MMNELFFAAGTPNAGSTRHDAFDGQALYDRPAGSYDGARRRRYHAAL
jgi:hypothetical protein